MLNEPKVERLYVLSVLEESADEEKCTSSSTSGVSICTCRMQERVVCIAGGIINRKGDNYARKGSTVADDGPIADSTHLHAVVLVFFFQALAHPVLLVVGIRV